jgi:hypothetical protein
MKCKYCGKHLELVWSSHKFTVYMAPEQRSLGKAGVFCNARTDVPCHEPA